MFGHFLCLNIERLRHQLCQYWPFLHASLSAFSALIFSKTSPVLLRFTSTPWSNNASMIWCICRKCTIILDLISYRKRHLTSPFALYLRNIAYDLFNFGFIWSEFYISMRKEYELDIPESCIFPYWRNNKPANENTQQTTHCLKSIILCF